MRFHHLTVLAAAMMLVACAATESDEAASDSAESEGESADTHAAKDGGAALPTYAEEATVIQAHCNSCHSGKFSTLAKVKLNRANMIKELEEHKMPKDTPSWSSTAAGVELLDFLQSSPQLK